MLHHARRLLRRRDALGQHLSTSASNSLSQADTFLGDTHPRLYPSQRAFSRLTLEGRDRSCKRASDGEEDEGRERERERTCADTTRHSWRAAPSHCEACTRRRDASPGPSKRRPPATRNPRVVVDELVVVKQQQWTRGPEESKRDAYLIHGPVV